VHASRIEIRQMLIARKRQSEYNCASATSILSISRNGLQSHHLEHGSSCRGVPSFSIETASST
jgi:hypothetical protein